jgi:hypothetical protein
VLYSPAGNLTKGLFLIPYVLIWFGIMSLGDYNHFSQFIECFTKWPWSLADVFSMYYVIVICGLPFLLYCFPHVTNGRYAIAAKILCFIFPAVASMTILFTIIQVG